MVTNTTTPTIVELIEITKAKLIEEGYSQKYRNYIRAVYNKLLKYADKVGASHMSEQLQEDFARDVYGIDVKGKIPKRDYVVRCTNMLLDMQNKGEISIRMQPKHDFPMKLAPVFGEFYNTTKEGKGKSTLITYRYYLMLIAKYLDSIGITDISEVTKEIVSDFTLTLSKYTGATANRILAIFSKLLNYAYEKGYTIENISATCMKVRLYRDNKIPSVFTKEEVEQTLSQIDRETKMGKRDYALLLLSARTGLRSGDIRKLKFKNVRFDTNTIEISQNKTGKMLVLPLTEEVGLAIIDYLKNARPNVQNEYIFLKTRAPFDEFRGRMNTITKKYMRMANIENLENRRPGFHSFRHSLASSMLETGTSIYTIKEYLGHDNTNTTMGYMKIDLTQLQKCALEVPNV